MVAITNSGSITVTDSKEYVKTNRGYRQAIDRLSYEVAVISFPETFLPHLDEKELNTLYDLLDDIAYHIAEEYDVNIMDLSLDVNAHTRRYADMLLQDNPDIVFFLI